MTAAVTRAKQLNAKALAAPTAGNAGGALAAYAAVAGIPAVIVMPADTPSANVMECQAFGAKVIKINGLISDCGKYVAEHKDREGWYDVSTLKEPYRIEGKKTMGYELWEQLGGKLPDVILYPTGGGVGLIGMCKAFDEMQEMGWIGAERPRMVAVQAEGCAPIVKAWEAQRRNFGILSKRRDLGFGPSCSWSARRLPDFAYAQANSRDGTDRNRRRDAARWERTRIARRNFRCAGRCRYGERDAQARDLGLDQAARDRSAIQYWDRLQIFGSVATRSAGVNFQTSMKTHRIYYDDAYVKEFDARVMYCEVRPPDVNSGITSQVWGLVLDRTAFYPTSGGQPNDLGKIGDANVLDVRDDGRRNHSYCRPPPQ